MTLIAPEMKMADVIHRNYMLIPIINRFGIHLGFGEKTVKSVCTANNIDPEFFVTIINIFCNEIYFPEKRLQTFNVMVILEYLRKTHNYYLDNQIPIIEKQIGALINSSPQNHNLELVGNFFQKYKSDLRVHISREESLTFPYIEKVYNLYHKHFDAAECRETLGKYSIKKFDEEHDNIDDKLYDLQSILIKYITGSYDESLINTVIFEIFRLEKDIKDHTRLEDKVLIPMVLEIENELIAKNSL